MTQIVVKLGPNLMGRMILRSKLREGKSCDDGLGSQRFSDADRGLVDQTRRAGGII